VDPPPVKTGDGLEPPSPVAPQRPIAHEQDVDGAPGGGVGGEPCRVDLVACGVGEASGGPGRGARQDDVVAGGGQAGASRGTSGSRVTASS
jgi:hypothetical protein